MGGAGYDDTLPNEKPFMYVESHKPCENASNVGIIAFGAYNAMGLIGSEMGGVAIVCEKPKQVIATLAVPWSPSGRKAVADQLVVAVSDEEVLNIAQVQQFEFRFDPGAALDLLRSKES